MQIILDRFNIIGSQKMNRRQQCDTKDVLDARFTYKPKTKNAHVVMDFYGQNQEKTRQK
jgi:hypothetical protein